LFGEDASNMGAEKSGGAGDESFQSLSKSQVSCFATQPTRYLLA
jgi:hypothetical protein